MSRRRGPEEALDYLKVQVKALAHSTSQKHALLEILVDPDFAISPAAQKNHHAYTGGLVVHTAEVLEGCLSQSAAESSPAILVAAAVTHDCMKVRDYEENLVSVMVSQEFGKAPEWIAKVVKDEEHPGGWRYTDYASKIRHVAGSYAMWVWLGAEYSLDQNFVDSVGHCILAHHGRQIWGSPVEPQTVEAMILHHADMISAHYGPGRSMPK